VFFVRCSIEKYLASSLCESLFICTFVTKTLIQVCVSFVVIGAGHIVNLGEVHWDDFKRTRWSMLNDDRVQRIGSSPVHVGLNVFADADLNGPNRPITNEPITLPFKLWMNEVCYPPHFEELLDSARVDIIIHRDNGWSVRLFRMSYREYFNLAGLRKYFAALVQFHPALPVAEGLTIRLKDYEVIVKRYRSL
jgi:hypothetical protein